jgi:hypothetical protein
MDDYDNWFNDGEYDEFDENNFDDEEFWKED